MSAPREIVLLALVDTSFDALGNLRLHGLGNDVILEAADLPRLEAALEQRARRGPRRKR